MTAKVERPEDAGGTKAGEAPAPSAVVKRWLLELDMAEQHEREWRERGRKIVELYRDEKRKAEDSSAANRRYNILYSNTEVLKGAVYSQAPIPDVRRRFVDRDPVGRIAAQVMQRALAYSIDAYDFDGLMARLRDDALLPGRGVAWVKYAPTMQTSEQPVAGPDGQPIVDEAGQPIVQTVEEVVYEEAQCDYIEWEWFRYSPCRTPEKLRWVARGDLMTRDDLVAEYGEEIGNAVELKWAPAGVTKQDAGEKYDLLKRALVWTVWNKTDRKVYEVCNGYDEAPLRVREDPLGLEQFFPTPRPLEFIRTTDSMTPVPEYTVYQDHAIELDALNERIAVLTDALRRRGVYDASNVELSRLANAGDNEFVPVDNFRAFSEKGGLNNAWQELDISTLAQVILRLRDAADRKKEDIYEVIGISDIMRGATKSTETLGAQQIKNQWGSLRIGPRQKEVARYARDLLRLKAEIIAEHFSWQTLALMTGIQLAADDQDLQVIAAADSSDPRTRRPTWEQVMEILRSDKLRGFKIDIETDSTVAHEADTEQKNRIELITSLTSLLERALPAVQQGMMPKKVATEIIMFGVRAFPVGPHLEEVLDEWADSGEDEGGEQQQDPAQAAMQADQAAQVQHGQEMRGIEQQTALARMVREKALAYQEIAKGEALEPGLQLQFVRDLAKTLGIVDQGAAPPQDAGNPDAARPTLAAVGR